MVTVNFVIIDATGSIQTSLRSIMADADLYNLEFLSLVAKIRRTQVHVGAVKSRHNVFWAVEEAV